MTPSWLRFGPPRNETFKSTMLSQPLVTMSAHLDQLGVARIVDALIVLMDDSMDQPGDSGPVPGSRLERVVLYEKLFKKVAVRLDERDLQRLLFHPFAVGHLQRILLDALPSAQKRLLPKHLGLPRLVRTQSKKRKLKQCAAAGALVEEVIPSFPPPFASAGRAGNPLKTVPARLTSYW